MNTPPQSSSDDRQLTRRQFLGAAAAGASGLAMAACGGSSGSTTSTLALRPPTSAVPTTTVAAGPTTNRLPGSLPDASLAAGTDTIPEIDHIVVVMMENHSYDNVLGMSGRGDGFTLDAHGLPTAANPDGHGNLVHAYPMPNPCQQKGKPWNTWDAAHQSYDNGKMDGFVTSPSGPVAMGYLTESEIPFTYGLARTFPVADRYFCSAMVQTYPNRRYLIAATSNGQVSDTFPNDTPKGGTIFDSLNHFGVPWKNYYSTLPTAGAFISLLTKPGIGPNLAKITQFWADAASGSLPGFSIVDPDFAKQSEEDPQDVQFGDQFLGQVVNAVLSGPKWSKTLLIWCYDEHGGYYDHVAPPAAVTPDDVPPELPAGDPYPGAFDRYGMRVPAGVVSPFSKQNYVSHTVYDHTSILKLVETKWNLPALTRRDANAADMLDMVDFHAPPPFLHPPVLPIAADPGILSGCESTGPGVIPPPGAVTPA